ncbi:adenylyl-sulfate kinase [Bacteroidota bacterium]
MKHIYPIFDLALKKEDKETMLNQKARVIWIIGLSGSGKSSLARGLENSLHEAGYLTILLDGDNLRTGVNNNLGFSEEDREENIRRTAEVAKLFGGCGVITICSFISPTHYIQSMARSIIGEDLYREVYIDCPLDVCEQRDTKGLYAKARRGEIINFTGIDSPFEVPLNPDLEIRSAEEPIEASHQKLVDYVLKEIKQD